MRRRVLLGCLTALCGGISGCSALETTAAPQSNRTQRPPTEVRSSLPESVDQTFDVTVEEQTDGYVRLRVTTTLSGGSEDLAPTRMTLKFNEDNELQDEAVISDPEFGQSITKTLSGDIGTGERDVSLSSHTEFEPHGSLSLHYTKLLPEE